MIAQSHGAGHVRADVVALDAVPRSVGEVNPLEEVTGDDVSGRRRGSAYSVSCGPIAEANAVIDVRYGFRAAHISPDVVTSYQVAARANIQNQYAVLIGGNQVTRPCCGAAHRVITRRSADKDAGPLVGQGERAGHVGADVVAGDQVP